MDSLDFLDPFPHLSPFLSARPLSYCKGLCVSILVHWFKFSTSPPSSCFLANFMAERCARAQKRELRVFLFMMLVMGHGVFSFLFSPPFPTSLPLPLLLFPSLSFEYDLNLSKCEGHCSEFQEVSLLRSLSF